MRKTGIIFVPVELTVFRRNVNVTQITTVKSVHLRVNIRSWKEKNINKQLESDWAVKEGFLEEVIFEQKPGAKEFNEEKGGMDFWRDESGRPKGKL